MHEQEKSDAQGQLDDEARAEDKRDKQIAEVKSLLDDHEFELLSEKTGKDFKGWYTDKYEDGASMWIVACWILEVWKCNGVEVDTEAVATAFIDWIGD